MSTPDEQPELYSSCDACRARKFKCPKQQPSCNSCLQHGWSCHYSPKLSRTPLTRSNLTAAESRVRELEAVISSLITGLNLDAIVESLNTAPRGVVSHDSQAAGSSSQHTRRLSNTPETSAVSGVESLPREADGFDWDEHEVPLSGIADGMAALSIDPAGAGYLGATSSVAPLRALLHREGGQDRSSASPIASHIPLSESILSDMGLSNMHESTFIDAYFSHYHRTYPFLHEPTFRAQFNGTCPRPDGYSWFMLFNTVLALGAWCIGDDHFSMDDYFYQRLLRVTTEISVFETGNLALVQALLLLSNYTQKRNRPNTGWNYLGLAVRTAVSLGLHKEFSSWEITPLQREIRRRVWWGLVIFDSGASITFGRPVLLPDPGIMDASEVLNIHEESLTIASTTAPSELDTPTIYTGLISQSRFHMETNTLHHRLISRPEPSTEELLSLQGTIDQWDRSLPSYFQPDAVLVQTNSVYMFARFRLSWRVWNMKIMLLRPVLLRWSAKQKSQQNVSPETQEEMQCRRDCLKHAQATIASISDFMSRDIGSRLSTWYILYFLFQAGLIPIILLMTDPTNSEAPEWLQYILTTRDLMNRTAVNNNLATKCLEMFNRLCSPVFDAPVPEDVLQNPDLFDGGFEPYSFDDFGMMEFGDWQRPVFE